VAWVFATFFSSAASKSKGAIMIYLTAIVAALTFGYLLMAMIRPEWF
jgi:hypothetical protein